MRSRYQNFLLILMLGILDTLTPFSMDMYLPSFLEISKYFSTSIERVAFSASTYFLGFALGQLVYGPFLDRYGRKHPIYIGLVVYIGASICCAHSNTIEMFFFFRFLQALGGSVGTVGAIAMVRDFFPVEESAKIFSLMMLVISVSPLLAPTVGSLIVSFWDWRVIFYALTIVAILNIGMVYFFLPEGHKPDPTIQIKLKPILKEFRIILLDPHFCVYTFAGSFAFAGLFVFIGGSPAIFMETFKVTPRVYSLIFGVLATSLIGGSQLNIYLTQKFKSESIFKTLLIAQVIVGAAFFIGSFLNLLTLHSTVILLLLYLLTAGITYPNAAAVAMAPFSKNAGSAAALLGFLQMGVGAIISSAIGLIALKGILPSASVMAASSVIGLAILIAGKKSLVRQSTLI